MADSIAFVFIIIFFVSICVGFFLTDCCIGLCDEDTIQNESDTTISQIHDGENHVEL